MTCSNCVKRQPRGPARRSFRRQVARGEWPELAATRKEVLRIDLRGLPQIRIAAGCVIWMRMTVAASGHRIHQVAAQTHEVLVVVVQPHRHRRNGESTLDASVASSFLFIVRAAVSSARA